MKQHLNDSTIQQYNFFLILTQRLHTGYRLIGVKKIVEEIRRLGVEKFSRD